MNNIESKIQEDAKSDWMKIVKRHKKKQRGIPALSSLNTDAGNVEHNINMFNMMNGATETSSSDAFNSSSGCCESTQNCNDSQKQEVLTEDKLDDNFDMSMRTLL